MSGAPQTAEASLNITDLVQALKQEGTPLGALSASVTRTFASEMLLSSLSYFLWNDGLHEPAVYINACFIMSQLQSMNGVAFRTIIYSSKKSEALKNLANRFSDAEFRGEVAHMSALTLVRLLSAANTPASEIDRPLPFPKLWARAKPAVSEPRATEPAFERLGPLPDAIAPLPHEVRVPHPFVPLPFPRAPEPAADDFPSPLQSFSLEFQLNPLAAAHERAARLFSDFQFAKQQAAAPISPAEALVLGRNYLPRELVLLMTKSAELAANVVASVVAVGFDPAPFRAELMSMTLSGPMAVLSHEFYVRGVLGLAPGDARITCFRDLTDDEMLLHFLGEDQRFTGLAPTQALSGPPLPREVHRNVFQPAVPQFVAAALAKVDSANRKHVQIAAFMFLEMIESSAVASPLFAHGDLRPVQGDPDTRCALAAFCARNDTIEIVRKLAMKL